MNALALLAVFLGLIAVGLIVTVMVIRDDKAHKRDIIGAVPPPPDPTSPSTSPRGEPVESIRGAASLQAAAPDLIAECELLERRNEWLESQRDHCKDVLAASMAQTRILRRDKTRMEVAERMEAP